MGIAGVVGRFGSKVLQGASAGLRLGTKVLGGVSKVGHKVLDPINRGVNLVSKIPFVGALAEPLLAPVRGALGLANSALGVVDSGASLGRKVQSGVRATQSAVKSGDYHQAANVMRDTAKDSYAAGSNLKGTARSVLERSRR
jgi:hypothetical protein